MVKKFPITSINAAWINQDTCERAFATLRALGGNNDRMHSVDFIYRLARFCMGAGKGITVEKANILFNTGAKTLTIAGKNNRDLIDDEPLPDKVPEEIPDEPVILQVKFWADGEDKFLELKKYLKTLLEDFVPELKEMTINVEPQPGTSTTLTPMEIEGFSELGGYFSKKNDPELATLANEPFDEEVFVVSDWINTRNWGWLHTPRIEFRDNLIDMYKEFTIFHKDAPGDFEPNELSRLPNVTKDFAEKLKIKFPEYPEKFYRHFSFAISMFRKRILNQRIFEKESFRSKRKMLEYEHETAKKGKMTSTE